MSFSKAQHMWKKKQKYTAAYESEPFRIRLLSEYNAVSDVDRWKNFGNFWLLLHKHRTFYEMMNKWKLCQVWHFFCLVKIPYIIRTSVREVLFLVGQTAKSLIGIMNDSENAIAIIFMLYRLHRIRTHLEHNGKCFETTAVNVVQFIFHCWTKHCRISWVSKWILNEILCSYFLKQTTRRDVCCCHYT